MFFLKIILFLYFLRASVCDGTNYPKDFIAEDAIPKKIQNFLNAEKNSTIDANKKAPAFRFRSPFMDMELTNQRNLHIIQERRQKQQIYVIHGNELYQMFVGRDEKRLSFVGHLGSKVKDTEPLSAEIITIRDFLILVIALDEYLEVYQLSKEILKSRAQATKDPKRINETAPIFETIQQLSLPGRYRQHFLTDPSNEHVMLIVTINFTKLFGRLETFAWSNSYFEPIEELSVPHIHGFYIMGTYPKYLVHGRSINHQAKTLITVAEIQPSSMTLHTTQKLTVNSQSIQVGSFRGKHYLIACSNNQKECTSFRMSSDSGQFNVYKQRPSKDLSFDHFMGGQHFLVAVRQKQILVFTSGRLDCYASFKTNESDITSILTLVNEHGEDFILLNYKRPFKTLMRIVELESVNGDLLGASSMNGTDIEDTSVLFRHRHMIQEIVGALRSLLLRRRNAMITFHRLDFPASNITKPRELVLDTPVRIYGDEIQRIKLVGEYLRSPLQLLQRVADLRQNFRSSGRFRRDAVNQENFSIVWVKNLQVRNLIYEDSVLPGFHLDKFAVPLPIVSVRPKLITNNLTTNKLLTRHKVRRPREEEMFVNSTSNVIRLKELKVVSINDVVWQDFYDFVFLKNRDTTIKGRLILQNATDIKNLSTTYLNGDVVDDFFNLREPQLVESNILFSGFLIRNISAESVNGLDFANDIVFQNTESFIESPVNMYQLSIAKDLLLSDNITIQRTSNNDEPEFRQHYTGKVIINGTLTVKNLSQEQALRTKIFVDRKPFSFEKIKQKYLLHKEPQHFNSTVRIGNSKVTVSSLETRYLNDNPTEEHFLVNQKALQSQPLFLSFMNAHIEGDLILEKGITRIANLSQNTVRRNEMANITGIKVFEAPISIDDVMTLTLNGMPVSELILKTQLKRGFRFSNTKSFNRIDVEGVLIVNKALNVSHLNKLPLKDHLNADYHFKHLQVPQILKAKNMVFQKINGINVDKVFESFKIHNGELFLHKNLIVEGSLKFKKNLNVTYINDINWQHYQKDLVRVHENAKITGKKIFLQDLTITNALETITINDMALEFLFERVLSKTRPQTILGYYAFGSVRFSDLDAPFINDVPTTEFIDMRAKNITINGDVIVSKLNVLGNAHSNDVAMKRELKSLTNKIDQQAAQKWRNIVVIDNAYWNQSTTEDLAQHELLSYIYKNAVKRTGQQVISGNVKFIRPLITKMTTKTAFPKNLDLDFFVKDCVLKNAENTQIITSEKNFLMSLQLQNVEVHDMLDAHFLNGIDISRFNSSLYRLSSKFPIMGPLKFRVPVAIKNLYVEELLNGISPTVLYHNITEPLPPLKIRKLIVDKSLQINEVNGENLDYFLENRLTKHDALPQEVTGYLNFQNLVLNENNILQSVNDMLIENLVFKKSKQLQSITGSKTLQHDLQFKGPAHVLRLNGMDITENYHQTLFKNQDYEHDSLKVQSATFEKGLIISNNSEDLEHTVGAYFALNSTTEEALSLQTELQTINEKLNMQSDLQKNLLYLDEALNFQITCSAPNASVHENYHIYSKRISLCERQFQNVEISNPTNETAYGQIYLSNYTSNFVTVKAHNISVRAENFCEQKYRKAKSKITITTSEFTRVIGLKKYIENIFIYKPAYDSDIFLLLHETEFAHNRHEVRVLQMPQTIQQNITDWQSLTIGIGKSVRLFDFGNYTVFISGGGLIENRPTLVIYHFNSTAAQFQLFQSIIGDFDVFELLPTQAPVEFQLLLSCQQCRQIQVYAYKPLAIDSTYEIFQLIRLKTYIDRIQPFRLSDGSLYMLLLGEHNQQYYYLYRYTQLQGWLHTTYGYFENIEMVIPLASGELDINDHNLLALLCGSNKCKIIKAIVV